MPKTFIKSKFRKSVRFGKIFLVEEAGFCVTCKPVAFEVVSLPYLIFEITKKKPNKLGRFIHESRSGMA